MNEQQRQADTGSENHGGPSGDEVEAHIAESEAAQGDADESVEEFRERNS
jgi:hypothetical protein